MSKRKTKAASVIMMPIKGEAKTTGLTAQLLAPKIGMNPQELFLYMKTGAFDIHNRCCYDYGLPGVEYEAAEGFKA